MSRMPPKVALSSEIEQAMWEGDADRLYELAPCECCCDENYSLYCPAQAWGGCRGQGDLRGEERRWLEHSKKYHGFTESQFYAMDQEAT